MEKLIMLYVHFNFITNYFNSNFSFINIIALIAALSSMIAFIPQSWKVIKFKNTKGISLLTFIFYNIANLLWICWAVIDWFINGDLWISDLIIIIPNFICILSTSFIIYIKVKNIIFLRKNIES